MCIKLRFFEAKPKAWPVPALSGSSARAPQGPTSRPLQAASSHATRLALQIRGVACGIARCGLARYGLLVTLAGAVRFTQRTVQRPRTRRARDRPDGRLSRCREHEQATTFAIFVKCKVNITLFRENMVPAGPNGSRKRPDGELPGTPGISDQNRPGWCLTTRHWLVDHRLIARTWWSRAS